MGPFIVIGALGTATWFGVKKIRQMYDEHKAKQAPKK
jgi:hypothetical protein